MNAYRPLLQDEIRLVKILPGKYGDPLHCSLEHYNLAQTTLTHTAISYPWGPPEDPHHPCWVDNVKFIVRDNAYTILSHLRQPDHEVKVWIDCLCIDQLNKAEKSAQIKLMYAIYKRAVRTVVWLGHSDEACDEIVDFVRQLDIERIYAEISKGWLNRWIQPNKTFVLDLLRDHSRRVYLVDSIARLFFAVYWSRVWIRQEAAVGGNPQLLWGQHELSWQHVAVLAWIYRPRFTGEWTDEYLQALDYATLEDATDTILSIDSYRLTQMTSDSLDADTMNSSHLGSHLMDKMISARPGSTTKAHDKVYAMTSLSTDLYAWDKRQTGFLEPNYFSSWQEVYLDAAKFFFSNSSTAFYVLENAGLWNMGASSDLPSWVPDWRHKIQVRMIASDDWIAGGNRGGTRTKFSPLSKKQRSQLLSCKNYATITPLCVTLPQDRCHISQNNLYLELKPKELLPISSACQDRRCKDKISKAEYNRLESMSRAVAALEIECCMQDVITYVSRDAGWKTEIQILDSQTRLNILAVDAENLSFLEKQAPHRIDGLYITDEPLCAAYDWTVLCAQDSHDRPATPELISSASGWRSWLADSSVTDHLSSRPDYHVAVENSFAFRDHAFAYTAKGYMCLVPKLCRIGDKVTIINGYAMPFVIRPVVGDFNMLLGQCYVHGMMTSKASELADEFLVKFDQKSGTSVVKRPQGDVRANGLKMEAGRYVDILETLGTRWVQLI